MVEVYNSLRQEVIDKFYEEDKSVSNLPFVSIPFGYFDLRVTLKELNVCLGQLFGYLSSKLARDYRKYA